MPDLRDMEYEEIIHEFGIDQPRYLVALAIFYFQEIDEPVFIPVVDIRDLVDEAVGLGVDTSQWLYEMRDQGLVEREDERYRLTNEGLEICIGRVSEGTATTQSSFLSHDIDRDSFRERIGGHDRYIKLIEQINRSYRLGVFPSAALLGRKLFEQLVFDILHDIHQPHGNTGMFYNSTEDQHYGFNNLLTKLEQSHDFIKRHHSDLNSESDVRNHVESIREFKDLGDRSAHSIRVNLRREELDDLKVPISETFGVLYTVLLRVNQ